MGKKVKELYDCNDIISSEELYPLQKWYNQLIDKSVDEITIADVLRMIRQNEFMDIAIQKAIEFLQYDVFAGELYAGEILEKISTIDHVFLMPYFSELKMILKKALEKSETYTWSYNEEKEEFKEIISFISKTLEQT